MKVEINTNEYVYCELTIYGMNQIQASGYKPEIIEENLAGHTTIRIQLWELMQELGHAMYNGSKHSIVNNKITFIKE